MTVIRHSVRGATAAQCAAANEVLLLREECIETNTGRRKVGDGVTAWNDLSYVDTGISESDADLRYRQIATALIDADIPAAIARDSEVTAAIAAHVAASDPHGDRAYAASLIAALGSASSHPASDFETPAGAQSKVDALGATLLGGTPPGTLDTFVEIAAQFATDESGVAALTTAVAGKLAATSPKLPPDPTSVADGSFLQTSGGLYVVRNAAQQKAALGITTGDVSGLGTAATTNTGTGAANTILGNDARLTDSRTPSTHAATHLGGGTDAIAVATGSVSGLESAADKTKLDGVATGATANSSDATLLNRANHTGTQAIGTVTGVVPIAQVPTGTSGTTVPFGNDSRFTDARTPTAHAASHASAGADAVALAASQITSGTVAQARLGTGSAGAGAKFLADDQTYKTVSGGSSTPTGAAQVFAYQNFR